MTRYLILDLLLLEIAFSIRKPATKQILPLQAQLHNVIQAQRIK